MICVTIPTLKFSSPFMSPTHKPKTLPLSSHLKPTNTSNSNNSNQKHTKDLFFTKTHILKPFQNPNLSSPKWRSKTKSSSRVVEGEDQMWVLCGFGYWVQGFRCFPWLALNFHMVHGLSLSPSVLQLVQHTGSLPLVAKPLFGFLSDAVYIGGAHRVPYISIGGDDGYGCGWIRIIFLQVLSWGTLALIPTTGATFPTQMACILLSNLGASITEVVNDALVAEFSKTQIAGKLQSYAFIALAAGALLGNLSGGFCLQKIQETKIMFLAFALLLNIQLALSLRTKEILLPSPNIAQRSISENVRQQLSEVIMAINEENIFYPLLWIVASTALVPLLSGSLFCFQTQCLNLDPSIIGLSKVVGQLMILSATVFYDRHLKILPMRTLIFGVQTAYALSFILDLCLVTQYNLKVGIPNEIYVLCFSSLAEALAQFKILPFTVLFSRLCPSGCEGSLFAFFASALCLSSIFSGVLGVGLSSFIGVTSGDYSSLPMGILVQILAALVPLGWIACVPNMRNMEEMKEGVRRYKTG